MVVLSERDVTVTVDFLQNHIEQYSKIRDAMIDDIDNSLKKYQKGIEQIKTANDFLKYNKLINDTIKTKTDIQKSVNTTIAKLQSTIDLMHNGSIFF